MVMQHDRRPAQRIATESEACLLPPPPLLTDEQLETCASAFVDEVWVLSSRKTATRDEVGGRPYFGWWTGELPVEIGCLPVKSLGFRRNLNTKCKAIRPWSRR